MLSHETIQCPYCGQSFELELEILSAVQRYVTDCEVCCRPIEIEVECESGELVRLDVRGN